MKHVGTSNTSTTTSQMHIHEEAISSAVLQGMTGGFLHHAEAGTVPRRALLNEQQGAGWHSLSYWIARPFAQSPAVHSLDSDPTNWWDCMGGGDHGHDHHTTAPSAAPSASPSGSPTTLADLCSDTATACYLVCSQQYINCLADPGTCTTLYAPHPAHCRLLRRRSEGRVTAQPCPLPAIGLRGCVALSTAAMGAASAGTWTMQACVGLFRHRSAP